MSAKVQKVYTTSEIVVALIAYSICSSMMLVINKLAMRSFPIPAIVNLFQLITCTIFVYAIGFVVKIDHLEMDKVKPYALYVVAFACGIYANMRALELSNVETIIVFRAATPMCVAVIEYLFLNRELPNSKSCSALAVIMVGAAFYVYNDFEIASANAYIWVMAWYLLLCFQMTYGKMLLKNIKLDTVWGPVLYTNILSVPPTIVLGMVLGDFAKYEPELVEESATLWVGLSCVFGIAIGYCGWAARDMVSATTYTLVGVVNKLISIGVSVTFINKNASATSIAALLVCLIASTQYSQPPERTTSIPK